MNNATAPSLYQPPVDLPTVHVKPETAVVVRRARVADVQRLYELINHYAAYGDMLPKTLDHLYRRVREFKVADAGGEVVGCSALQILWHDLAEIVSLTVHPDFRGRSLGRYLVEAQMDEARQLGMPVVVALTLKPAFFSRLGFREVPRLHLPHKIWQECTVCFKQECCDEVAMIREVG